jgi:hypothetical protein
MALDTEDLERVVTAFLLLVWGIFMVLDSRYAKILMGILSYSYKNVDTQENTTTENIVLTTETRGVRSSKANKISKRFLNEG